MGFRFCDDLGGDGFGWVTDEAYERTSHALAVERRVWLVDPLTWPEAIERARGLGEVAGVLQLLDRHERDCAALAASLQIPHLVVPDEVPASPFVCVAVVRRWRWSETALWWPERRTLVVADALGTSRFYTGGRGTIGVHLLLRLTPPRMLDAFEPDRVLVGHGEGILTEAAPAVRRALERSRSDLLRVIIRLPFGTGRSRSV